MRRDPRWLGFRFHVGRRRCLARETCRAAAFSLRAQTEEGEMWCNIARCACGEADLYIAARPHMHIDMILLMAPLNGFQAFEAHPGRSAKCVSALPLAFLPRRSIVLESTFVCQVFH